MPQTNTKAINFAPVENGEKRVELNLDGDRTVIRLSSWVDGLGWCGEKTMQIDADMLEELHGMLGAARVRIRRNRADNAKDGAIPHKVLNFPSAA